MIVPSMIENLKPEHLVRDIAGSFWLFSGALNCRRDDPMFGFGLALLLIIRAVFKWGVRHGKVEFNPCGVVWLRCCAKT